ncbi:MAG: ATP-binding protein [Gammaproteobacteria bacterium]
MPTANPDRASLTAMLAQHHQELRRQFAFSMFIASLPLVLTGLILVAMGQAWPFGVADILFGGAVLAIRQWALARDGIVRIATGCFALGMLGLGIIGWHALFTGQSSSFALWYLPCIPVIAALLGTARMAVGFALAGSALSLAILASEYLVTIPPSFPVPGWLLSVLHVMVLLVTAAYSVSARMTNDAHMQRLQLAWAEAEAARQTADAANRAKSDFLAVMSHEIRTPLNGVVGLNSLLLSLPLDDKARQYAELGRQSGEALLSLVNEFLDFSKIESGRMDLHLVAFSPRQVLDDAVATVRETAQTKSLQLNVDVAVPPALRGDPARLRQILVNLLGNAVKFTASGTVSLRVRTRSDTGSEWMDIEVADIGIGIDAQTQQRLFQPFSQADASTTRRFGGTGLGLAICKALTDLMGGSIGVESVAGEGSRFRVLLPFAPTPPDALVEAPTAALPASAATRGRVLVAEDNPVNQLVAAEMLRRLGYVVDVVGDGREAIRSALAGGYDLVLMDCDMPEVDGFAACRTIRAREAGGRHLPVVAMTASAMSGDRERCLAAGMDDYLAKPVRLRDIERVTTEWIARRPS